MTNNLIMRLRMPFWLPWTSSIPSPTKDLEEGKNWRKYRIDLSQFLHMVQSVKHMQSFLTT